MMYVASTKGMKGRRQIPYPFPIPVESTSFLPCFLPSRFSNGSPVPMFFFFVLMDKCKQCQEQDSSVMTTFEPRKKIHRFPHSSPVCSTFVPSTQHWPALYCAGMCYTWWVWCCWSEQGLCNQIAIGRMLIKERLRIPFFLAKGQRFPPPIFSLSHCRIIVQEYRRVRVCVSTLFISSTLASSFSLFLVSSVHLLLPPAVL